MHIMGLGPSLQDLIFFRGIALSNKEAQQQRERAEREREAMIRKSRERGR
jgi:hypothetical protein